MITVEELQQWARGELDEIKDLLEREEPSGEDEAAGRCYRVLGDWERAERHLRVAVEAMIRQDAGAFDYRGGLYRLLGEHERAAEQFRRSVELYAQRKGKYAHARTMWPCFMLGDHEAVVAHAEQASKPVPGEVTPAIGMLSRARLEGDPGLAGEALAWLEREIRRERGSPFHSGGVNMYDIYEVGVDLQASLEGAG